MKRVVFTLTPNIDSLLERSSKIGQGPHRQQIDANQRLGASNTPHPSGCIKRVVTGLQSRDPVTNIEFAKADVKGRQEAELETPTNGIFPGVL